MRGRSAIQIAVSSLETTCRSLGILSIRTNPAFPTLEKSRNRTLVDGTNCGENDDGVLLETVACEDGNCTKGEQHSHVDLDCNGNQVERDDCK